MSVFEIPQRLLGGGPLFPVRLDRIAKFGQRRLSGQDQMRGVTVGFPGQQIRRSDPTPRANLGCGRAAAPAEEPRRAARAGRRVPR